MSPAISGDEAAFWAASEAAPGDDAPLLVYSDWLDERGRDQEAAAVRRFLPNIQAHLAAGVGVAVVRDLIARQDPAGPAWGFESPPAALPRIVEPPALTATDRPIGGGTGEGPGMGGWLVGVIVAKAVILLVLGVARHRNQDQPPPLKLTLPEDQLRWSRVTKDGKEYISLPLRTRPPDDRWDPAEVAGHMFRLAYTRELRAVVFRADGRAAVLGWEYPGIGFPRVTAVRWAIDPDGVLVIAGLRDGDALRVRKLQGAGSSFKVDWDGLPQVYSRVRTAAADRRE